MSLFPKNVMHFVLFTNKIECERFKQDLSNKVVVLNVSKCPFISIQKCQENKGKSP